jgi:ATP-binding cassette subfamily B protein
MMPYGGGSLATRAEQQKKRGRKTDPRTMKRVLEAFRPYRPKLVMILAAILITSFLGLAPSLLISHVFDDAIGKGNAGLLLIYVSIMAAALILSGMISVGQGYLSNKVGQSVMYDFRNKLYQHLQGMPLSFFTGTRTGEIQSRLSNDIGGIQGTVTNTATTLLSDITIIVSTTIAMIVISPLMTVITFAMLPVFAWITYKVGQTRRRMSKETQKSMATLTAQMEETLSVSGILLLKVFGQQKYAQAQFQQENKTLADLTLRQLVIGRVLVTITYTLFSLLPILIYLLAGEQIIQHQSWLGATMTLGTMVAFTTLQVRVFFPLGELAGLQVEFQGALALFDRIFEYLDLPTEIQDKPNALQLTPEKVRGEVTFRDVTFSYKRNEYSILADFNEKEKSNNGETQIPAPSQSATSPDPQEEPRPALHNISFTIKPGQLVALVGPSGAGKTTITYLLPRLYDVDSGTVEIDDINVKDIAQTSLGELIGVVTQETYLFHASIRENLLYARRDASEEEMIAAAQAAAIHERIMELEDGYDTIVGERGYKLSGGEKQRIAIARVVLKNPRILILDEATSALDTRSERLIQTALEKLMKSRTTLAIAHRLSTILAADLILVVNKGRIVERGTHQELLALGGLYAQLYHEQFSQLSTDLATVETGSAQGTIPTVPVFATQISYLQPSEVTMQEKTAIRTGKLPLRVASKEDLLSTTYLLPNVRKIFTLTPESEQAVSPPQTGPVAFVKIHTTLTSVHQVDAPHKGFLKRYALVPENANAHALVLDRNPVTTRPHVPHREDERTAWRGTQEYLFPAKSAQRVIMDVLSITKSLPLGRERIELLKGISFQIRSGEFVAIVGPSGSGKSTLLGIIAGLDQPTSGQVLLDDVDLTRLSEEQLAHIRNQKIGMVFQAFNLLPMLTAQENVEAPLQVGKRPGSHSKRAQELLALVGLSHRLSHRPNQLSGGEQQRVAIARALATDPAIIIADEPTGNLDARNGENILQLIARLRIQTGKTFIIATHDPTVAAHADRAIRLVDGSVATLDTTDGRITQ